MATSETTRAAERRGVLHSIGGSRRVRRSMLVLGCFLLFAVLFYAEENRRGVKAWERCRARLASKGVQLDWHKLTPAKVPDEENFASTPFFATLFDFAPGTYTPRDLNAYNAVAGFAQFEAPYAQARRATDDPPAMNLGRRVNLTGVLRLIERSKRPGLKTQPEKEENPEQRHESAMTLLGQLEPFRRVFDELQNASARPQSRFNLNYDEEYSWAVPQPHLPVLERISRVLAWRGCAELAVENPSAAAQDAELVMDLAATLHSEPFRSSLLTRNAMLDNARQVIWEGLARHQWSIGELNEFQSRLGRLSLRDLKPQVLLDRTAGNGVFEMVHKDPSIVNGWTFGSSFADKARGFIVRHMPTGWMYLEQAEYQNRFEACAAPAFDLEQGRVYPSRFVSPTSTFLAVWHHRLLADLILYSSRFLCSKAALAQTGIDQTQIACALERYRLVKGQLPLALDALGSVGFDTPPLDVITGQSMKYHVAPDGQFALYSVGWNEKDDGGKTVMDAHTKMPDLEQGDWVWPAYPQ